MSTATSARKTRRQSKLEADAAEHDNASVASSSQREPSVAEASQPPTTPTSAPRKGRGKASASKQAEPKVTVTVPAHLLSRLSPLFPGQSLSEPDERLILACYERLLSAEEWRAKADRLEVEIDMASAENSKELEEVEKQRDELSERVETLQQEKDHLAAEKDELQQRVASLSSSSSTSHASVDALQRQVDELETEKRGFVDLVGRMSEDSKSHKEEVDSLRAKLKESRQEVMTLQGEVAELRSSDTNARFKIQTLEQELELVRKESSQWSAEVDEKTEQFAKYRKEKHAEILQISGQLSALESTHAQNLSQLTSLRNTHNALLAQHHSTTEALSTLRADYATLDAQSRSSSERWEQLRSTMEARADRERARVEEVEAEWERAEEQMTAERREYEAGMAHLQAELEDARQQITDLNLALEVSQPPMQTDTSSVLAESVLRTSRLQVSGGSYTNAYANLVKAEKELRDKDGMIAHLRSALNEVVSEMVGKAAGVQRQREEHNRMMDEMSRMSMQITANVAAKNAAETRCVQLAAEARASAAEAAQLKQQATDLGRQVRALLREVAIRDDPMLAAEEVEDQPGWQGPENGEGPMEAEVEAGNVVDRHLVLFSSLKELQERNVLLLKMTRALGRKLEEAEKGIMTEDRDILEAAEATIEREKAEHEADLRLLETYKEEAERWKGLAMRRDGQGGLAPAQDAPAPQATSAARAAEDAERKREDDRTLAMRQEQDREHAELQKAYNRLQREHGDLGAELARAKAALDGAQERQRMTAMTLEQAQREVSSLNKRNHDLQVQVASLGNSNNHAMEQFIAAEALAQKLRIEVTNLRAENQLRKGVEDRLTTENVTLAKERAYLSDLMRDLQSMRSQMERSGDAERSRFEGTIKSLESELHDTRMRLSREIERTTLSGGQKDNELKTLRNRSENLARELSDAQRDLQVAKSQEENHRLRMEDLTRQLAAASEKLSVYERGGAADDEDSQQMEMIALRSALKVAERDLEAAQRHVQQYQNISSDSEAALLALNQSTAQYKATTDELLAQKDAELQTLVARVVHLEEDLNRVQAESKRELEELQVKKAEAEREAFELRDETARSAIEVAKAEEEKAMLREDMRQHSRRTDEAHAKYEAELVAHGEAVKALNQLKQQYAAIEAKAARSQAAAETAASNLAASETSWQQQKATLEKEISDLNSRYQDLVNQNNLLHQHIETVTSEATRVRRAAEPTISSAALNDSDTAVAELRAVISYLRQEKDIAVQQLELLKAENARLKSGYDRQSRNLEETRAQLTEERQRAAEVVATTAHQQDLLQKINDLSAYRDSNVILRQEQEMLRARATELEGKVTTLTAELDPLKEQLRSANADLEARAEQIRQLEEQNQHWQTRANNLLHKYDQIDPDEFARLKAEKDTLAETLKDVEAYRDELLDTGYEIETKLKDITEDTEKKDAEINRLKEFVEKWQKGFNAEKAQREALQLKIQEDASTTSARIAELTQELGTLSSMKDTQEQALKKEIEEVRNALTAASADLEKAKSEVADAARQSGSLAALQAERDRLLAEKQTQEAASGDSSAMEQVQRLLAEKQALEKEKEKLQADLQSSEEKAQRFFDQFNSKSKELADLQQQVHVLQARLEAQGSGSQQGAASDQPADQQKVIQDAVAAAIQKQAAEREEELKRMRETHRAQLNTTQQRARQQAEAAAQQRLNQQLESLQTRLAEMERERESAIRAAVTQAEDDFKTQHASALQAARDGATKEAGFRNQLLNQKLATEKRKNEVLTEEMAKLKAQLGGGEDVAPSEEVDAAAESAAASETSAPAPLTSSAPGVPVVANPAFVTSSATTAASAVSPVVPLAPAAMAAPPPIPSPTTPLLAHSSLPARPAVDTHPIPTGPSGGRGRGSRGGARGAGRGAAQAGSRNTVAAAAAAAANDSAPSPTATGKRGRDEDEGLQIAGQANKRAKGPITLIRPGPVTRQHPAPGPST